MDQQDRIIRLGVAGATGRLGRAVMALAADEVGLDAMPLAIRGRGTSDATPANAIDVILDVSSDRGCRRAIEVADAQRVPIVIGTTGLQPETLAAADRLSRRVAVMIAPNLSRGAAVMRRLAALAAKLAPSEWSFDLVETHRRGKRDAPSGTALAIVEETVGPDGRSRLRDAVASIRTGEVVGEHRLRMTAWGEELVIEHRALDRSVFARGGLDAARWILAAPPGRHRFESMIAAALDEDQGSDPAGT